MNGTQMEIWLKIANETEKQEKSIDRWLSDTHQLNFKNNTQVDVDEWWLDEDSINSDACQILYHSLLLFLYVPHVLYSLKTNSQIDDDTHDSVLNSMRIWSSRKEKLPRISIGKGTYRSLGKQSETLVSKKWNLM